jgi:hypothetical protein
MQQRKIRFFKLSRFKEQILVISLMMIKTLLLQLLWREYLRLWKNSDGSISEAKQVIQHGRNKRQRQEGPLYIWFISLRQKFVLSNDLRE